MKANTSGLEIFEIEVDFDDPRWGELDPSRYGWREKGACAEEFPLARCGKHLVKVALFPPNYFARNPTYKAVIDEIRRRHLRRPDRAVTETILDARKAELAEKRPIVGICGSIRTDTNDRTVVSSIHEFRGRVLFVYSVKNRCDRGDWFIAVVSETPI